MNFIENVTRTVEFPPIKECDGFLDGDNVLNIFTDSGYFYFEHDGIVHVKIEKLNWHNLGIDIDEIHPVKNLKITVERE